MANGGIIGPVNTVNAAQCQSEVITSLTSTHLHHQETQPLTTSVNVLLVAGGAGGGHGGGGEGGGGGGAGGVSLSNSSSYWRFCFRTK